MTTSGRNSLSSTVVLLRTKKPWPQSPSRYSSHVIGQNHIICSSVADTVSTAPYAPQPVPRSPEIYWANPIYVLIFPQETASLSLRAITGLCSASSWARLEMLESQSPKEKTYISEKRERKSWPPHSLGGKFWDLQKVCNASNSRRQTQDTDPRLPLGGFPCFSLSHPDSFTVIPRIKSPSTTWAKIFRLRFFRSMFTSEIDL